MSYTAITARVRELKDLLDMSDEQWIASLPDDAKGMAQRGLISREREIEVVRDHLRHLTANPF